MSKYHRLIGSEKTKVQADVYDILTAFKVVCPARQHAIKKLLCAGQRGAKSEMQDIAPLSDVQYDWRRCDG